MSKSTKEGRDLRGLAGYQLQRVNLKFHEDAARRLAQFDISPARFSALLLVRDNPGCTQTALGEALEVNRASAMKIINYLEERGLVTRAASEDQRANALFLTPLARKLVPQMLDELAVHEEEMMAALSPQERAQFLDLLVRIRRA